MVGITKKKLHTYRRIKAQRKERKKKDKTGQNKPDDMEEI